MDRLETITTFVTVVRCASFTAAADQLGLSRSMVSKHINELETRLKVKLLTRTTRSVAATEIGSHYFEFCSRMLGEMQGEEERLAAMSSEVEGRLSVVCPKWPGDFDLSEALATFCRQNPRIRMELAIGGTWSKPYEFLKLGHDISLQAGPISDSRLRSRKIGDVDYMLVASPDYLAERGCPASPDELPRHDCLVPPTDMVWRFLVGDRSVPMKVNPRFVSNSFPALRKAALMGLGIAMVPHKIVVPELRAGLLVKVLGNALLETTPLYAAYAPDGVPPRKVRALLDFLSGWFRSQSETRPASGLEEAVIPFEPRHGRGDG